MSWPTGFAIHPCAPALDPATLEAFRHVPSAHLSDCLGRSIGAQGLLAYHQDIDLGLCGMAVTVRVRPGDNLMIHKAMLMASPGDVIVVDGGGCLSQAVIGGLMRTTALARRLGGIVIDGAIRDVGEWAQGEIPVYARGHVHRGPSKQGPGEVNVAIACAGMSVAPGDLIIGDADGVIAVPRERLDKLLEAVRAQASKEAEIRRINRERGGDEARIDSLLRSLGCPL